MVKDHSYSDRGNLLPPLNGLLFSICIRVSYNMHHTTHRIAYTTVWWMKVWWTCSTGDESLVDLYFGDESVVDL